MPNAALYVATLPNSLPYVGSTVFTGAPSVVTGVSDGVLRVAQAQSQTVIVGASQRITWTAVIPIAIGGGSAANGDVMQAVAKLDGTPVAGYVTESAMAGGVCTLTITATVGSLVVGSSHSISVSVVDATNGSNSFVVLSTSGIIITYWAP